MAFSPGTYILGPSHSLRIVPNTNPLGLPSPIILDGDREKFTAKYDDELIKNDTIDNGGRVIATRIPGGVSGSIEFVKAGQDFANVMKYIDNGYFNGVNRTDFTMTESIILADGSTETNQYLRVQFHGYDKGNYQRKDIVKPSIQFFASQVV